MVDFILGFHCHQPVGNFESVFKEVHDKSYSPLIRTISKSRVRFCFHASGVLLEWWEKNDPELLNIIAEGVSENRIELMGGGYYEPILASIPRWDRKHQLEMLSVSLNRLFGKYPEGAWITERIWQPDIIADLKDAGIKYAFLDDYQFYQAGISPEDIDGIFRTEYGGDYFDLFPIHERLRYKIPFANPLDSLNAVLYLGKRDSNLSVMFDDGEKMGAWPDTYDWVYGKDGKSGWLEDFINIAREAVNFKLPSDILNITEKRIPVYLPISSYREMGEWTLPAEERKRYEAAKARNDSEVAGGGIWHYFFLRYPEVNLFHKRMLNLSGKINYAAKVFNSNMKNALNELLKSQANDAYWHGVFGGVYLPHLRRAVHKALIAAYVLYKNEIKCKMESERFDFDMDGENEIQLSNDYWLVIYKPSDGTFITLDYLEEGLINSMGDLFCLHNEYDVAKILEDNIPIKCEPYENGQENGGEYRSKAAGAGEGMNPPATIHKDVKYPSDLSLKDLIINNNMLPAFEIKLNGAPVYFKNDSVEKDEGSKLFTLTSSGFESKEYFDEPLFDIEIKIGRDIGFRLNFKRFIVNGAVMDIIFRFTLPGGNGPAASFSASDYTSGLDSELEKELNVDKSDIVYIKDTFWGGTVFIKSIAASRGKLNFRPVKTISLSENGYERIFQGVELVYEFNAIKDENRIVEFTVGTEKL